MPPLGVAAFYFFNLLDPLWNWRWDITSDPGFQKWLALALVIGFIQNQGWRSRFSRSTIYAIGCIGGFLFFAYISSLFSAYPQKCLFNLDVLWRIVLVVTISLLVVVNENRAMLLAMGCVFGQVYNSYQINLEYFQLGYCRYAQSSTWGFKGLDNNTYSILTIPVIAISIAIVLGPSKWWIRLVAIGISLLQVHQLMLMESRGAMLGAILVAGIAVFYCPKTVATNSMLMLGAVLVSLLAGPPVVREFASIFGGETELDVSAESRFHLWKAGIAIMKDYPILGVGPGCSLLFVPKYYDFQGLRVVGNEKALHNLFFEIMCENGIVAGFFFFGFFLIPWFLVWSNRKRFLRGNPKECTLALAVIAGVPGYFLASMFSSGSLIESSYVLPIIACGLLSIRRKVGSSKKPDSSSSEKTTASPQTEATEGLHKPSPLLDTQSS